MKKIFLSISLLLFVIGTDTLVAQWEPHIISNGSFAVISSVVEFNNNLYAGTSDGLFKSSDEGVTWTHLTNGLTQGADITTLTTVNNTILAGSNSEGIYRSVDDGNTWVLSSSGILSSDLDRLNILFTNGNAVYLGVGSHNVSSEAVYVSVNNGVSWQPRNSGIGSPSLRGADEFAAVGSIVFTSILGQYGSFSKSYYTADAGASWIELPTANNGRAKKMAGKDNFLFAAFNIGLLRTSDLGQTWSRADSTLPDYDFLEDIETDVFGSVYVALGPDQVYRSDNHGLSWEPMNDGLPSGSEIYLLYRGNNYIFGGGPLSDTLWRHPLSNSAYRTYSRNNLNLTIGDMQYSEDTIYVQTDNLTPTYLADVNVMLDTILHPNVSDLEIYLIHQGITDTLIYQVGGSGDNFISTFLDDSASISTNNGSAPFTGSFRPESPLSQFNNLEADGNWILQVYDAATGNIGTLQAWSLGLLFQTIPVSVKTISANIPDGYTLFQNYPNPFNPSTVISFSVPQSAFVTLKIYDVLGNELTTLLNEEKPAGTYEVDFGASQITSGVYFYKLQAGSFVETKKMILLR